MPGMSEGGGGAILLGPGWGMLLVILTPILKLPGPSVHLTWESPMGERSKKCEGNRKLDPFSPF